MSAAAPTVGEELPISKSEFARRRGVSPGRVTQWITDVKIDGAAIVGEGRNAQIVESLAVAQLKQRLDVGQRFSGNGLGTRLDVQATAAPPVTPGQSQVLPFTPKSASDAIADQIARERLDQMQRANRREALEEAAEAGRFTDTLVSAQAWGRNAAQMVATFEGALPELAGAIAGKFNVPQRDVLHLLRSEFRKVRANAADLLRRQAQDLPAMMPVEIGVEQSNDDGSDNERRAPGDGGDGESMGTAAAG